MSVTACECDLCGNGNESDGLRLCWDCESREQKMAGDLAAASLALHIDRLVTLQPGLSKRGIQKRLQRQGHPASMQTFMSGIWKCEDVGLVHRVGVGYYTGAQLMSRCESEPERVFWGQYLCDMPKSLRGLVPQVVVGSYRLDFAVASRKLCIEVDGLAYHNGQASFMRDRSRERALQMDGWRVLRFAAKEVTDGASACVLQAAEWAAAQ